MKETRKDVLIGLLAVALTAALIIGGYFLFFKMGRSMATIGRPVWIDDPAPAFILARYDNGAEVSLEDLQGRLVVLNFWSATCVACLEELNEIEEFYQDHLGEVEFFAVNTGDSAEEIEDFLKKHEIEHPVLLDRQGKVTVAYGLTGVPETVFIDAQGIVRWWIIGPASSAKLEEGLRSVVQGG